MSWLSGSKYYSINLLKTDALYIYYYIRKVENEITTMTL
jgi:hypothetical protein